MAFLRFLLRPWHGARGRGRGGGRDGSRDRETWGSFLRAIGVRRVQTEAAECANPSDGVRNTVASSSYEPGSLFQTMGPLGCASSSERILLVSSILRNPENDGFSFVKYGMIPLGLLVSSLLGSAQVQNDSLVAHCENERNSVEISGNVPGQENSRNPTDRDERTVYTEKNDKRNARGAEPNQKLHAESDQQVNVKEPNVEGEVDIELPVDKLTCHIPRNERKKWEKQVVLLEIGSFNPITFMHLRMLEMARDKLLDSDFDVLGAYISPVNDSYKRKNLISSVDRIAMCKLAVQSSPFIMIDEWEANQKNYQRTLKVLKRIESKLTQFTGDKIQVVLVCGSDLLESFLIPGVWIEKEVHEILNSYGIVCVVRDGKNVRKIINESEMLYKYRKNIWIVDEVIENNISSSRLRQNLSRGLSIKYLTSDNVVDYIQKNHLYS